jgi:hypothetical protein
MPPASPLLHFSEFLKRGGSVRLAFAQSGFFLGTVDEDRRSGAMVSLALLRASWSRDRDEAYRIEYAATVIT